MDNKKVLFNNHSATSTGWK